MLDCGRSAPTVPHSRCAVRAADGRARRADRRQNPTRQNLTWPGPSCFAFSNRIFPRQVGNHVSDRKYPIGRLARNMIDGETKDGAQPAARSEEHTSELQSLMRSSYAVFCLKTKNTNGDN